MKHENIKHIAEGWRKLSMMALDLKKIEMHSLHQLLRDSYRVARENCHGAEIPRELCRLMLEMKDFLYFASLMEKNEVGTDFYHYVCTDLVIGAIENGVLNGVFECRLPRGRACSAPDRTLVLDLENDDEFFVRFARRSVHEAYSAVRLSGFDFNADEA